jgi:hypothetical protein
MRAKYQQTFKKCFILTVSKKFFKNGDIIIYNGLTVEHCFNRCSTLLGCLHRNEVINYMPV